MRRRQCLPSQQVNERLHLETCLAQDRTQRSSRQLAVHGDDGRPACLVPKLDMTATLTDLAEASLGEGAHDVTAGDNREARAHAGMSTGAMIGVST